MTITEQKRRNKRHSTLIFDRGDYMPIICLIKHLRSLNDNVAMYKKNFDRQMKEYGDYPLFESIHKKDLEEGMELVKYYKNAINKMFKERHQPLSPCKE